MKPILLLAFACLLQACANFSAWPTPPSVSLQNIQISDANATSSRLLLDLAVSNPNAVTMPIEGLSYQLRLNGYRVIDGVSNSIDSIPAYGTAEVQLEARADLVGMFSLLSSVMSGSSRQVDYELESKISIRGLWQPLRLVDSGTLPLNLTP